MLGIVPKITVDNIPRTTPKDRRPGVKLSATSITIHNTANEKSTAKNERDWLTNPSNTVTASWHYAVDQLHAVEAIPTTEVAYHAGTKQGNNSSIGIEVCESGDQVLTWKHAVGLTAKLLHERKWEVEKVRTHKSWSGKNCPRLILLRWNEFIRDVKETLDYLNKNPNAVTPTPKPDNTVTVETPKSWKHTGVEKLNAIGILDDLKGWKAKVDEAMPVWAVCTLIAQAYEKLTGKEIVVPEEAPVIPPVTPEPEKEHLKFVKALKSGATGEEVKALQNALIKLGYDMSKYGADGSYGPATVAIVTLFQSEYGLAADGMAGSATFKAINDALNGKINKVPVAPIEPSTGKGYRKIRHSSCDIHIYETSPDEFVDVELGKKGLEPLSKITKTGEKVVAKTNGGFFNTDGTSEHLGTYIDEGLYHTPGSPTFIDFIYYKDGSTEIKNILGYDQAELSRLQKQSYWAIGTSWSLVQKGIKNLENQEKIDHSSSRHPRTLLGQKKDGSFLLVVVDGRNPNSRGMTASESADLMLSLGIYNAVNLDGGGSSEMIVDDVIKNVLSDKVERRIGSAILVYKR
jgi:N-acetyl-anhydromuramyl-L-alanine amidase AmpD